VTPRRAPGGFRIEITVEPDLPLIEAEAAQLERGS
jgi:hypothetical protein